MANVGSLFIELGINTAAFAEGMNKATYAAKAGVSQIGASFQQIGSRVAELGANFGEFGTVVGQALGTVGSSLSKLVRESGSLSGMGGALKVGAIGFGALAAGAATAGAAVVGIAIHASETAAKIYELSESTGVGVKELSGLGAVASLVGINTETLGRGLERMSKSALAAAESPNKASNAYRTLGISVTDSEGKLKGTSELFAEVAGKFSTMQDGAEKTALAMQIFGRSGAELIPILNKGADGIKYWVDYATQVGAVLDEHAAAGAHAFSEEMTKLGLISTGVQNKLMAALLPALDHIVASLTQFLAHGSAISDFGSMVGSTLTFIAGIVYRASYAWDFWGAQIRKVGAIAQLVATGQFKAIPDALNLINSEVKASSDKLQYELDALSSKSITPSGPANPAQKSAPAIKSFAAGAPIKLPTDEVAKYIATLENAVKTEQNLAATIGTTTEQIKQQEATAAAEQEVFKLREGLTGKLTQLEASLATAKEGHTAATDHQVKQLQAEIVFIKNEIVELDTNKQKILDLIAAKTKAQTDAAFEKQLVSEREKIESNIVALKAEIAAVGQSADAKMQASAAAKIAQLTSHAPGGVDTSAIVSAVNQEIALTKQLQIAKEAETLSTTKGYSDEIQLIQATMAAYQDNRDIQLAGQAAIQAATNKVTQAWDKNALEFGTTGEKIKAVLNEIALENQNVASKIATSFKTAFDGISKNIADMVTTGKSNFKSLFASLEQSIIQTLLSAALNDLLKKLSGVLGASDNSSGGSSGGGGIGGFFSKIIGSLFGGGKASGGPVSPGVGYLIGERGPEAFVPRVPGTIVPNSASMVGSPMQGNVNIHVYGATDPDSFRKASSQIATAFHSQMRMAAARNLAGG